MSRSSTLNRLATQFGRLFQGPQRKARMRPPAQCRPRLEGLERRELMTCEIGCTPLSAGTLYLRGYNTDDNIDVVVTPNEVYVSMDHGPGTKKEYTLAKSDVHEIKVDGLGGNDKIRIAGNSTIPNTVVDGGSGNDSLEVFSVGEPSDKMAIQFKGGAGADSLIIHDDAASSTGVTNITGSQITSSGHLTIGYDAGTESVTFDGKGVIVVGGQSGRMSDIRQLTVHGEGISTLILNDSANTPTVTFTNKDKNWSGDDVVAPSRPVFTVSSGQIERTDALYHGSPQVRSTINYSGFSHVSINAGPTNDTFKVQSAASALTIRGGTGIDTLDYSAFGSGVKTNLVLGTSTGLAAIAGIENVTGSQYTDLLVGDAAANVLIGGSGHDLLIGGAGADTLDGGSGHDLLIGGTTAYDNNAAALATLLGEWSRTDLGYSQLTARLRSGVGTGTPIKLDASTVRDDNARDTLLGGANNDWFFAAIGEIADPDNRDMAAIEQNG